MGDILRIGSIAEINRASVLGLIIVDSKPRGVFRAPSCEISGTNDLVSRIHIESGSKNYLCGWFLGLSPN
jgi:hypothetical protein